MPTRPLPFTPATTGIGVRHRDRDAPSFFGCDRASAQRNAQCRVVSQAFNAEDSGRFFLRLIQSGQRATQPHGELYVEGVIGSESMIAANDLYRPRACSSDAQSRAGFRTRSVSKNVLVCSALMRPLRSPTSSVLRTSSARKAGTSACSPALSRSSTSRDT